MSGQPNKDLLAGIEGGNVQLKKTTTQEKNVLPSKDDIAAEKNAS